MIVANKTYHVTPKKVELLYLGDHALPSAYLGLC